MLKKKNLFILISDKKVFDINLVSDRHLIRYSVIEKDGGSPRAHEVQVTPQGNYTVFLYYQFQLQKHASLLFPSGYKN